MKNSIDNLLQNKSNIESVFSEYEIIDWYDGAISGIGKLSGTNEFYWFNLVAYDLKIEERIFVILQIDLECQKQIRSAIIKAQPRAIKKMVTELYLNNLNKIYLLKSKSIDDKFYDLKETRIEKLKY